MVNKKLHPAKPVLTQLPEALTKILDELLDLFQGRMEQVVMAQIGEKLLSAKEACQLFQPAITRSTLQSWTAAGYLKRRDIGGRVYYRYSEVIEAAKHLKKYKQ